MKRRLIFAATVALVLSCTGTITSAAHADEVVDADVGGGAAGVMASVYVQSYDLGDLLFDGNDRIEVNQVIPRVAMGDNGGNYQKAIGRNQVGPVKFALAEVKVSGRRNGQPFADASTKITDVRFVTGPLANTKLGAIQTSCRWDTTGWKASTTILDANGTLYAPEPNTEVPIPGLGTLTLNEQYVEQVYVGGTVDRFRETVYVVGAHLHLEVDTYPLTDIYDMDDVWLGFTSCDPLQIPKLGGLNLSGTPSD